MTHRTRNDDCGRPTRDSLLKHLGHQFCQIHEGGIAKSVKSNVYHPHPPQSSPRGGGKGRTGSRHHPHPSSSPSVPDPKANQRTTPHAQAGSSNLNRNNRNQGSPPSAGIGLVGGSQPQIVVAKQPPSPGRTSRPTIQHGSSGYSYGSGPVATEIPEQRRLSSDGERRRRRSSHVSQAGFLTTTMTTTGGRRSSGSVTHGHPSNPRQSGASFRSTREKIVIVDANGRRRESGFY
ncbi:hypothetical protein XPA_005428 [Xanthoria parietina]